ncbi:peptide ABC transporter permease [Caballeronia mineralivorans PML1(12)]|uniref:Peptide ABC transporter permease n=1 Tax=Caballeronia mineralivorans PML1(12) TaxID=908627 RepID=A0A0J1D352_9BURK|nr:ABC transporter permease [Caballeronia mineralivorans]KLU27167.1 peptide ABC transporter permease [Caballeronia mineralivorans PML1(12)]
MYIIKRTSLMVLTLIGVSILIFAMMRMIPGNIVDVLFDSGGYVDEAQKALITKQLGLDKPMPMQYAAWIGGILHGDFGYSFISERPAAAEIVTRLPVTLKLAGLAMLFATIIGVPLGVLSAIRKNSFVDNALRVISISGLSLPSFWIGLLVLMFFVHAFGFIPIYPMGQRTLIQELVVLSLPAMVVGFRSSALVLRLTRSSMLEVLSQDYIRTAKAKGASTFTVNFRHALKNAFLPVLTIIGIEAAYLIGGLVVTETVFSVPGICGYLVDSINQRDYPVVQDLVLLMAFAAVFVNFLVDLSYALLDPRIKY